MDDFTKKSEAFRHFLESRGVEISPKVAIADFREAQQGRGLVALDEISEGEVLFSIPPRAMLRADDDPELAELVEKHELDSWSALIVKMMAAQSSDEWKPYFDVLPETFNTPMFWAPEETKQLLKGSDVVDKIGREEADSLYDTLASTILKEPYFAEFDTSREAFHRMGSLIMSYAFDVLSKKAADNGGEEAEADEDDEHEEEEVKAMVPLADTLNSHTKLQNARLTMPETVDGNFDMIASKAIHKGSQIYNIYGNQPSSDMLRRYGYVEAGGTSFEVVEISLKTLIESAVAVLNIPRKSVEKRLDALSDRLDIPPSFEIGLTIEDEDDKSAVPEVEFEPELLVTANALTVDKLKKKEFKEAVALAEREQLVPDARKLLIAAVKARREAYGEAPPVPAASASRVLVTREDMCAQVRLAELGVLDMALDWLDDSEPASKRQKNS